MGSGMNTAKTKAHEMIAKEKKKRREEKRTKKRRRNTKESRLIYHL